MSDEPVVAMNFRWTVVVHAAAWFSPVLVPHPPSVPCFPSLSLCLSREWFYPFSLHLGCNDTFFHRYDVYLLPWFSKTSVIMKNKVLICQLSIESNFPTSRQLEKGLHC